MEGMIAGVESLPPGPDDDDPEPDPDPDPLENPEERPVSGDEPAGR